MKITLRVLIEKGIIDENQKLWIYKMERGGVKHFIKCRANTLTDDEILDYEDLGIAEIQKSDSQWLKNNNFVNDYIGIYLFY